MRSLIESWVMKANRIYAVFCYKYTVRQNRTGSQRQQRHCERTCVVLLPRNQIAKLPYCIFAVKRCIYSIHSHHSDRECQMWIICEFVKFATNDMTPIWHTLFSVKLLASNMTDSQLLMSFCRCHHFKMTWNRRQLYAPSVGVNMTGSLLRRHQLRESVKCESS